jgi:anti-sigma B factor antagonist
MNASSKVVDTVVVITLSGLVNFAARHTLRTLINEAFTQGYRHFIVQMREVTFIDSSGLGALVTCFSTIRKNGGTMHLVQVAKQAYELMEMTRLTHFFEIFESEEEALERLRTKPETRSTKP